RPDRQPLVVEVPARADSEWDLRHARWPERSLDSTHGSRPQDVALVAVCEPETGPGQGGLEKGRPAGHSGAAENGAGHRGDRPYLAAEQGRRGNPLSGRGARQGQSGHHSLKRNQERGTHHMELSKESKSGRPHSARPIDHGIDRHAPMRAMVQDRYGAPEEVLQLGVIPKPTVGDGEVLVRVRAAVVSGTDWHLLRGLPYVARLVTGLRKPRKRVPGLEVSGTVEAVGPAVGSIGPGG